MTPSDPRGIEYRHADEARVTLHARPEDLFARLDDQTLLAAHMERPSMMMMGGAMSYEFDEANGRSVGSVIGMRGRLFGLELFVEGIVTERDPPRRKVWETRGRPHLFIIGAYRMGFEIAAEGG